MALMDRKKTGDGGLDGYIGPGTEIEGTVRFSQVLRVDGKITGKVVSERELIVGESAEIDAEIQVGSVSVSGRLAGKVHVKDRMEIHPGARVNADLRLDRPSLVIEEGGILEGNVQMGGLSEERAERKAGNITGFPPREEAGKGGVS
ncbi:MAG: polymer-forming cytoskeletal protein [Acidobacteriota bacterium]|jgi:cytoskeletal protein CcmA (bactofilin family)